jgi:parallel beta-helix repeat protein
VYYLPQGINIARNNLTLDGGGALLIGRGQTGRGVTISDCQNVSIQNLNLQEYYHGVYAQRCQGVRISNCRITATAEIPANTIFLDIWLPAESSYGGGIFLWQVSDAQVCDNDLQHQMNGLLTYECQRLSIQKNNASYCSGWGFHLYKTCHSEFSHNFADFCCRYQPRGDRHGHLGADAAGFLIVYASCNNVFFRNNARMSGDGFFLAGLSAQFEPAPCNDNLFEENDGSYSPNIAFEATFSQGNIFRSNYANRCNYGFWLGFSSQNTVTGNQVNGNRQAGIATENGVGIRVHENTFQENGHGILLWTKRLAEIEKHTPINQTSADWLIERNRFIGNRKAIRIAADQDHGIRPLPASGEWGAPALPPRGHTIRGNILEGNFIPFDIVGAEDTILDNPIAEKQHD